MSPSLVRTFRRVRAETNRSNRCNYAKSRNVSQVRLESSVSLGPCDHWRGGSANDPDDQGTDEDVQRDIQTLKTADGLRIVSIRDAG